MSLLFSLYLFGSMLLSNPQSVEFELSFESTKSAKGQLLLQVQNERGETVKQLVQKCDQLPLRVRLSLPTGKYAVSAFHDLNANGKLDKNMLGIPQEPYGFSRDARGKFGPPDLSDQLFEPQSGKRYTIHLK